MTTSVDKSNELAIWAENGEGNHRREVIEVYMDDDHSVKSRQKDVGKKTSVKSRQKDIGKSRYIVI